MFWKVKSLERNVFISSLRGGALPAKGFTSPCKIYLQLFLAVLVGQEGMFQLWNED